MCANARVRGVGPRVRSAKKKLRAAGLLYVLRFTFTFYTLSLSLYLYLSVGVFPFLYL